MNKISVSLLVIASIIEMVGNLWIHFLHSNFGSLENLSRITFGTAIVLLSLPLFLDTAFILAQRVHPKELSLIVEYELKAVESQFLDAISERICWHMWALDMSYRICTVNCSIDVNTDLNTNRLIKQSIERRLSKYCSDLTIQIS